MEGEIVKYNPSFKKTWDDFVESSKNGTFLFKRDYMDYHSDRFDDNSYMIYRKGKLYSLLPANIKEVVLYSHGGLTYGGLIMNEKCTAEGILEAFDLLTSEIKSEGIKKLIYKPVPYIYTSLPSQEDLYALFRCNASIKVRNISSTISLSANLRFNKDRREAVRRALHAGIFVEPSDDWESFWRILEKNLQETYNARPVHTLEEIKKLKDLFPENIKLYTASIEEEIVAGVVCYITKTTVHTQYISASPDGKRNGAVDSIISHIRDIYTESHSYLDLGTSNEDGGRYLNESLIYQKEGFGGRGVCYDTYEMDI